MILPPNHHCRWPPLPPRLALVVISVDVTAPKLPALMLAFGLLKCGVFVTPNASASNWKVNRSDNLKSRVTLMSRLKNPGPRRILRPALPKKPSSKPGLVAETALNAVASKYLQEVSLAAQLLAGLPFRNSQRTNHVCRLCVAWCIQKGSTATGVRNRERRSAHSAQNPTQLPATRQFIGDACLSIPLSPPEGEVIQTIGFKVVCTVKASNGLIAFPICRVGEEKEVDFFVVFVVDGFRKCVPKSNLRPATEASRELCLQGGVIVMANRRPLVQVRPSFASGRWIGRCWTNIHRGVAKQRIQDPAIGPKSG